jgi:multidrug efflux system outer membrane protein
MSRWRLAVTVVHMSRVFSIIALSLVAGLGRDANAQVPAPFWEQIRDSTLDALISEARRANTDVRVAEERLTAARASRRLAAFDLVPTVTAIGSTMRQQQSVALVPGLTRQAPQQQLWDVGFDASWEIDIFGRVANTVRAQQSFVSAAEYSVDDVQLSVAAEVARGYFELRGAQRQLAVSLRNAENQRRIVKLTEERLAAGRGTAFDTERAKSALYLTLAATPTLESQIAIQQQRIAVLIARTPGTLPSALLTEGTLPPLPDSLRVVPSEQLIRRRPDVQAAERRLDAESMVASAARSEYLPRLTLGARAGYVATSFDSLSRTGTTRWLAGPVVTFPFLDLGRVRQRVNVARAGRDVAQAEYRAAVVRAFSESNAALVTYDRAHERLAILEAAVASSTRASALAQQRFEAGLTDFLQVLDAQRTLLEAENQLAVGHTAAAIALVAVSKAVGGTWPVR